MSCTSTYAIKMKYDFIKSHNVVYSFKYLQYFQIISKYFLFIKKLVTFKLILRKSMI